MTNKTSRERALERQLLRLRGRSTALRQLNGRYAWLRLGIVLAGGVLCFLALSAEQMGLFWVLLISTLVIFNIAAYYHRKVQHSSAQHTVWAQIKATHVARMRLDWDFIPQSDGEAPAEHPFAADIDVTGEYSLHRLLDTTVSQEGSARLLDWLLTQTPDEAAILRRQAQIRELLPLTIFRDKLTLYGTLSAGVGLRERAGKWSARPLLHWLETADTAPLPHAPLFALAALSVVNIALAILNALEVLPPFWQLSWIVYVVIFSTQWRATSSTFEAGMGLRDRITRLREVFAYLEGYDYREGTLLAQSCAPFRDRAHRPAAALRRLSRIIAAASIKGNPILWLAINLVVPWDVYFAHQLRRQQARLAAEMPAWLEAWFELEALCALATFAYLNPAAVFPTFSSSGALLTTTQIGHPLIHDQHRISNDYEVASLGAVTIITGSNMSGKSTFLRTLGVNLVLAYAGAPVIAQTLETRLFRLYTCIRVSDSVTDGFSYFYAEVRRLRALLDALKANDALPLFFLIDEIFRGTNNRERLIGSRAYIRALAGHNGVGLISTHDLELVKLADELPHIRNFHFREEVHDGQMVFDYVLHDGPSPTTNALRIMALAGLPVE